MQNLLGVVLCGGESKRMGTDKGLIQQNGKVWAQIVADKIAAIGLPVVISINDRQVEDYGHFFSKDQLLIDNVDVNGPLRGLLTVHQQFPQNDILLLACDLIDMDLDTIQSLISGAQAAGAYEFYVYENKGLAEPFCAIYTSNGLRSVYEKALQNELTQNSFQSVLAHGNTKRFPLNHSEAFHNYNTMPGHHKF